MCVVDTMYVAYTVYMVSAVCVSGVVTCTVLSRVTSVYILCISKRSTRCCHYHCHYHFPQLPTASTISRLAACCERSAPPHPSFPSWLKVVGQRQVCCRLALPPGSRLCSLRPPPHSRRRCTPTRMEDTAGGSRRDRAARFKHGSSLHAWMRRLLFPALVLLCRCSPALAIAVQQGAASNAVVRVRTRPPDRPRQLGGEGDEDSATSVKV